MSLVFNMVGGGSGGGSGPSASDAILIVTVPTDSTVTMTKGGVTLTPTMWVQAADNNLDCALFVIAPSLFDSQNAWTVTATLGTDSASDTVTIDAAAEYELHGDQCVAITGGWTNASAAASTYTVVPVTISTSINYSYSTNKTQGIAITRNKIDLYNGDIIRVICSFTGKFSIYVISYNTTGWDASYKLAEYDSFTASQTVHELPITSNMNGYVLIGAYGQQAVPSASGSITKALIVRA